MRRSNDVGPIRADWMLCALVLAIALWGAALDLLSMQEPKTAALQRPLEQAGLARAGG